MLSCFFGLFACTLLWVLLLVDSLVCVFRCVRQVFMRISMYTSRETHVQENGFVLLAYFADLLATKRPYGLPSQSLLTRGILAPSWRQNNLQRVEIKAGVSTCNVGLEGLNPISVEGLPPQEQDYRIYPICGWRPIFVSHAGRNILPADPSSRSFFLRFVRFENTKTKNRNSFKNTGKQWQEGVSAM